MANVIVQGHQIDDHQILGLRFGIRSEALGRALLEAGNFEEASREFESVLAQVPDNILANKFLGETYHRMGRLDVALQKYQIAQTLAPGDAELAEKLRRQLLDVTLSSNTASMWGASRDPLSDEVSQWA